MALCNSVLDKEHIQEGEVESCAAAVKESMGGAQSTKTPMANLETMWGSYRELVMETFSQMSLEVPTNYANLNAGRIITEFHVTEYYYKLLIYDFINFGRYPLNIDGLARNCHFKRRVKRLY